MGGRLPRGVSIRQNRHSESLRISFCYRGVQCKETLRLDPTPPNIKYAERLLAEIHNAIERNIFNYADFFPDSTNCKRFGQVSSSLTFGELLNEYLDTAKKTVQPSTYRGYNEVSKAHLIPQFGKMRIVDVNSLTIREWIKKLNLTMKRVKNILIPMRHVLNQALVDQLIKENPLDKIVLTKIMDKATRKSDFEVDPFNENEIAEFLYYCDEDFKNLFQFAFFTGLRTSELIALEWKHIDWHNGTFKVEQAFVEGIIKEPKTKAGFRDVLILPQALEALNKQKERSYMQFETIFLNPLNGQRWTGAKQLGKNAWSFIMKKSKLRWRNMYQTRHTYGSMMVSSGENLWWIASQMGHENIEMILRHYGKWIEDPNQKAGYKTVRDWGALKLQKKTGTDHN